MPPGLMFGDLSRYVKLADSGNEGEQRFCGNYGLGELRDPDLFGAGGRGTSGSSACVWARYGRGTGSFPGFNTGTLGATMADEHPADQVHGHPAQV